MLPNSILQLPPITLVMQQVSSAMSVTAPTFVNGTLAKGLSKQSLEYLVIATRAASKAIDDFIVDAIVNQYTCKSPAKLATRMMADMKKLLAKPAIHGQLIPHNARSFGYYYVTPEIKYDHLVFSVAIGMVNTRHQLGDHRIFPVVEITRHSVERLHQRLNTTDFISVYWEMLGVILMAFEMIQAAKLSGSRQWALPSQHGMFIGVPSEQDPLTTLVTWLPRENLSTKWSKLIEDLREVRGLGGMQTSATPQLAEIMSRHHWLQEPYEHHPEPAFGPGSYPPYHAPVGATCASQA